MNTQHGDDEARCTWCGEPAGPSPWRLVSRGGTQTAIYCGAYEGCRIERAYRVRHGWASWPRRRAGWRRADG